MIKTDPIYPCQAKRQKAKVKKEERRAECKGERSKKEEVGSRIK
jgi:hypothetical protein